MMNGYKKILLVFMIIFSVILLIASCKKEQEVTGVTALEIYKNSSGYGLAIIRYMKNAPEKKFFILKDSTLIIESSMGAGADTTATIFYADSAKVIFDDAKSYMIKDTSSLKINFLDRENFIPATSPSGKTRYFRYTFTSTDYNQAK